MFIEKDDEVLKQLKELSERENENHSMQMLLECNH